MVSTASPSPARAAAASPTPSFPFSRHRAEESRYAKGSFRAAVLAKGSWMDAIVQAQTAMATGSGWRECPMGQEEACAGACGDAGDVLAATASAKCGAGPSGETVELATQPKSSAAAKPASLVDQRPKVMVKTSDMAQEVLNIAVSIASDAIATHGEDRHRDIARTLKEYFDVLFSPAWQCIVGTKFGCFATHTRGTFCYFFVGPVGVLLFRTIPAGMPPNENKGSMDPPLGSQGDGRSEDDPCKPRQTKAKRILWN